MLSSAMESQTSTAFQEVFGPVLGKRLHDEDLPDPSDKGTTRPPKTSKQQAQPKGKGKGKGKKARGQPALLQLSQWFQRGAGLVLRVLRQSTGWVWWLKVPEPTLVPDLFQAA